MKTGRVLYKDRGLRFKVMLKHGAWFSCRIDQDGFIRGDTKCFDTWAEGIDHAIEMADLHASIFHSILIGEHMRRKAVDIA